MCDFETISCNISFWLALIWQLAFDQPLLTVLFLIVFVPVVLYLAVLGYVVLSYFSMAIEWHFISRNRSRR